MAVYARKTRAAKKAAAQAAEKPKAKATPVNNMGLGKLKGVLQERKLRLDAAIDEQTGRKKKK